MSRRLPSLTGLAVALRIAEDGTFAAASRALGLSTSATSKAVARLESDLGVKLFRRTTRSVRLTAEGERFVRGLRPLLNELDALTGEISDSAGSPAGLLRISAPNTFGRVVLLPLIPAFRSQFPAIEIELTLEDRYSDLVTDEVDLVIRSGDLAGNASLVARRLLTDPLVMCASAEYLQRFGTPTDPDELAERDCICFRNAQTGRNMPWRFADDQTVYVNAAVSVSDMESVARLAMAGAGIAQVPGYLVKAHLSAGVVREILPALRPPQIAYSALYLDRRFVASRVRVFLDRVAANLQERFATV